MDIRATIPVTFNARGLAGIQTADGRSVAPVLFRADALATLTPDAFTGLAGLGIGNVVDFRTDAERERAADVLPSDGSVVFTALGILGGAMDEMVHGKMDGAAPAAPTPEMLDKLASLIPSLDQLYLTILETGHDQFVKLARIVIEAAGTDAPGVLFHCTAGKDRTGLAAAMLLAVAGVERGPIIADYTQTEKNLAGEFADKLTSLITALGVPLTPQLETLATKSPESAIVAALDWLDDNHGGAEGYLRNGGLSDEEVAKLRAALLDGGE